MPSGRENACLGGGEFIFPESEEGNLSGNEVTGF